jgi:hypothetical protein
VQQRRLAAARRSDNAKELLVAHFQIDPTQGADRSLEGKKLFGVAVNEIFHRCFAFPLSAA